MAQSRAASKPASRSLLFRRATLALHFMGSSALQRDPNGACIGGNAMASGQCACPTGSQAIDLQADSGCWLNTVIGFCWNGTAPLTKFGGAYQESDSTGYGANGCVVANPATAGCSCPAGTSAISMRVVWGPSNSGCKNDGSSGGRLVVCAAS